MVSSAHDLARQAAQQLAGELNPSLPALVEAQLQSGETVSQRYEPVSVTAIATLVLSVAKFAWDIYRDRKKDQKDAATARAAIARELRLSADMGAGVSLQQRDMVIAAVVKALPAGE